ncbi:MAG: hypothetical protein P9L97_07235 [Candidatus Tenebribacter davisii]|jgi:hypothetical protein|nr:hypothetical protein [Candidatus Tenebribacter davisii]
MNRKELIDWLIENGDAVIQYRTATELAEDKSEFNISSLRTHLMKTQMAHYWMKCLKDKRRLNYIHGSYDYCFENAMGKLIFMGIKAGFNKLEDSSKSYVKWLKESLESESDEPIENPVDFFYQNLIASFLSASGFKDIEPVAGFNRARIKTIYDFTKNNNFSIFVDKANYKGISSAFDAHSLVDPELYTDGIFKLPWVHDLLTFSAFYKEFPKEIDHIISYILNEKYQQLPDGYGIVMAGIKRYTVLGWNVWLPGYNGFDIDEFHKQNLILRMILMSPFKVARNSKWYKACLKHLKQFKQKNGTYLFPKEYLKEKNNSYFITGSHMGLGENRKGKDGLTLESTFWMLKLLAN